MNQLNVRDNTYIKIYDREKYTSMTWIGKFGHVYIGDYLDIDYNRPDHEVQLWIRDGWYDYDYILDHYSEIVEELENIHLEKTLQEL